MTDDKNWRKKAEQCVREHDKCERDTGPDALYYSNIRSHSAHALLKQAMAELDAKDEALGELLKNRDTWCNDCFEALFKLEAKGVELATVAAERNRAQADLISKTEVLKLANVSRRKLEAAIEAKDTQLPEGMKHCTIVFKQCELGHSRLVATNWTDPGCSKCALDAKDAEIAKLRTDAETSVPILPVDPEADRVVDELMHQRLGHTKTVKMVRADLLEAAEAEIERLEAEIAKDRFNRSLPKLEWSRGRPQFGLSGTDYDMPVHTESETCRAAKTVRTETFCRHCPRRNK